MSPVSRKPAKPTLLFVDHIFHKKTRSADFIIAILRESFDLKLQYVDPAAPVETAMLLDDSEYVVIWQMDFLTPLFIAAGKKVVVAQMFDGSGGLPDAHWELNRQAGYLNFSVALHARALALGAQSHLVRYFPDPSGFAQVTDFSTLRGFFWQRRPKSGVDLSSVRRMLGGQLDTLHVHTPADDGTPFDAADLEGFDCEVTRSDWFEKQSGFAEAMDRCNVFVAPRHAEGIGLAFLEAMARGMLVFAYDMPTHTEYIANWDNGILFNRQVGNVGLRTQMERVEKIGRTARLGMTLGHARWQKSHDDLNRFVRDIAPARVPDNIRLDRAVEAIMAAYQQGQPSYVALLNSLPQTRRILGGWRDFETETGTVQAGDLGREPGIHIFFGDGGISRFVTSGWSTIDERSHRWAVEHTAVLNIPLSHDVTLTGLRLRALALVSCPLTVAINGQECGSVPLSGSFDATTLVFKKPLVLRQSDGLRMTFSIPPGTELPKVEDRPLTFAVKSVDFDCLP